MGRLLDTLFAEAVQRKQDDGSYVTTLKDPEGIDLTFTSRGDIDTLKYVDPTTGDSWGIMQDYLTYLPKGGDYVEYGPIQSGSVGLQDVRELAFELNRPKSFRYMWDPFSGEFVNVRTGDRYRRDNERMDSGPVWSRIKRNKPKRIRVKEEKTASVRNAALIELYTRGYK